MDYKSGKDLNCAGKLRQIRYGHPGRRQGSCFSLRDVMRPHEDADADACNADGRSQGGTQQCTAPGSRGASGAPDGLRISLRGQYAQQQGNTGADVLGGAAGGKAHVSRKNICLADKTAGTGCLLNQAEICPGQSGGQLIQQG